ncbi:hypothetical protein STXM2123_5476 [Streptomyces sp. F-3]|jgi:hypothetical protein|uniref:Uncharacterized protein n=1 Tax=Streptomyces thermogriseus TaxID=75292 RepID=A0ABN1T2X0_9ACTN|nr:hypothetical protein STXM2123_5476 [Streptomyces sp. F-3]
MSRALPKHDGRRVAFLGGAAAVVLSGAVVAGSAPAGTPSGTVPKAPGPWRAPAPSSART